MAERMRYKAEQPQPRSPEVLFLLDLVAAASEHGPAASTYPEKSEPTPVYYDHRTLASLIRFIHCSSPLFRELVAADDSEEKGESV